MYYIPDSFTEEATVLQGKVKVRSLIEMAAFAFIPSIIALNLGESLRGKVFLLLLLAGPIAAIAYTGVSGDYLSVFLKNVIRWLMGKNRKIYDKKPRPYIVAPIDAAFKEAELGDGLMETLGKYRRKRQSRKLSKDMENEDYELASNPYETKYQQKAEMLKVKEALEREKIEKQDIYEAMKKSENDFFDE